jgi:hypothetical protein
LVFQLGQYCCESSAAGNPRLRQNEYRSMINDKSMPGPITDPLAFPPTAAMVRLITHNLLACHVKGCTTNNFPLKLTNIELALREAEFNPDFLRGFLPRIEWDALIQASREVRDTPLFIWNHRNKL